MKILDRCRQVKDPESGRILLYRDELEAVLTAGDTISRQAAIAEFRCCELTPDGGIDANYAIDFLKQMPSAQPEQRWIPCSEKLPKEEKKTYWVCTDTEYQCECRWTNNRFGIGDGKWGWSIFDTPQYSKPIAWRPLPEPYKENKDERD